jgi:hypothetical protein
MPAALAILQALGAAASIISGLKNIFTDHDQLDSKLNDILGNLQELRLQIIFAERDILEAIDGIRRQIDELAANIAITNADTALFNDRAIFDDKEGALGLSLQAADLLRLQSDGPPTVSIVYAGPLMYVVNIRLALVKDFDQFFFCQQTFRDEFQRYRDRLSGWIAFENDLISRSHTVSIELVRERDSDGAAVSRWQATHFRNGVDVEVFDGPKNDTSLAAREAVERQANTARQAGIEADRQQSGVVDMEKTLAAWDDAFKHQLRQAMVSQVLGRPIRAIDASPQGLMVDGRMLATPLDQRATLVELLTSREFQRRTEKWWNAFVAGEDDRLVQVAYRRLFDRDATEQDVAFLRDVASRHGFPSLVATLFYSREYTERYGNGLPPGGAPIIDELNNFSS